MATNMQVKTQTTDWEWQGQANCKGMSPRLFFEGFEEADIDGKAQILKICSGCPVTIECGEMARRTRVTAVHGGAYYYRGKPKTLAQIIRDKEKSKAS